MNKLMNVCMSVTKPSGRDTVTMIMIGNSASSQIRPQLKMIH